MKEVAERLHLPQVLLGDNCHIYNYEGGGISALGGLAFHVLHNEPNGELPLDKLQAAVRFQIPLTAPSMQNPSLLQISKYLSCHTL